MEGAEKGGKSERGSPPLQGDPRGFQDASRPSFRPIKTDNPRAGFYKMYEREANECDAEDIKKLNKDLNTTSIVAGLLSVVSSSFIFDIHSFFRPNPNKQSAAFLRAILLTLDESGIPGEIPIVPHIQEGPPRKVVAANYLMCASLMISLLAAFVAMLAKQWVTLCLWNPRGPLAERRGNRQRKFNMPVKWSRLFLTNLLGMLQIALLLLVCGLYRYVWSIGVSIESTLICFTITVLGALFFAATVVSLYASPFQTPASTVLHASWRVITSSIAHSKRVFSRTRQMSPLLPRQSKPWIKSKDSATTHRTDVNDVECVSWMLRYINDPEAFDAAIQFAGSAR